VSAVGRYRIQEKRLHTADDPARGEPEGKRDAEEGSENGHKQLPFRHIMVGIVTAFFGAGSISPVGLFESRHSLCPNYAYLISA
jgi:hypothetical protein